MDPIARRVALAGSVLSVPLLLLAGLPAAATNCYEEIDPYYWTFDVPSMIHVNTVQDAATVRASVVNYLWAGAGYPYSKLPAVTPLGCVGDPPPTFGPFPNGFPQTFPGLVLWLDASDSTTVSLKSGHVSRWNDKSGLNNDATQNTSSLRPLYDLTGLNGMPAIAFDGVDDFLDVTDDPSLDVSHLTLFIVLKFTNPDNELYPVPLAKMPVNSSYLVTLNSDNTPIARGIIGGTWASTADESPVDAQAEIWSAVHDGRTLTMFRNRWPSESAPAAIGNLNATAGPLRLGDGATFNQNAFSGRMAEVILYDRALLPSERRQLEDYLGWKYGIWQAWPGWVSRIGSGNLRCVDRLDATLDYGLHSYSYVLKPDTSVDRLMIFQHGHSDFMLPNGGRETMKYFLDRGFTVETFWMPLYGENPKTATSVPGQGVVTFQSHDQMSTTLEDSGGSFIRFFLEPVIAGLNHELASFPWLDVEMAGISGGGWTTHLMAALDTRLSLTFPVAGSLPLYLRSGPCPNGSQGDSEQYWAPLYVDRATWLDLYALGGYGPKRKQVQVLNQYDSCCFWGVNYRTYEPAATAAVVGLGSGGFRVHLDSTHAEHKISDIVLDTVIGPEVQAQPLPYEPQTDLAVSQTDSPDPVFTGSPLAYDVLVKNRGPSRARGVVLTDAPPISAAFLSATPSQGSCAGTGPVTCALGDIAEGGQATVSIVVSPTAPGPVTNSASSAYGLADFRPANDSSSETTGVGVPGDRDGDGVADETDCAPLDWTAYAVPGEVAGLILGTAPGDKETLSWESAAPAAGAGTVHDVLRGDLAELPVGAGGSELCLGSRLSATSLNEPTLPVPGRGFWYLVRGRNACGTGTYGHRSDGAERTSAACP